MSLLDKASLIVTPNAVKASKLYSIIPSDGSGDMNVVRATTATRVNSSGLIENVGINTPRIDYTNGSCPSLLIEPQRTNSIFYSEQFDNISWVKYNTTITANSINSPSGLLNADFIIPDTINTIHYSNNSTANVTSGLCTYSIFAKKGFYKNILVWFDGHSGGIGVNLETLEIFRNTNITSYTINNYGNDWFRISITANISTIAIPAIYIYSNDATPQISWSGNGTGGLYVWGAQVEKTSSYLSSYIPTTSSAVTRNADVISKTGISSLIGQTEGTFFADIILNGSTGFYTILNTTNSITNAITMHIESNVFLAYVFANGVQKTYLSGGSAITNNRYKLAFAYKSGSSTFYVNGVSIGTSSDTFTFSNSLSEIKIADNVEYFSVQNSIKINSSQIYKTRLTNSELQSLTSL